MMLPSLVLTLCFRPAQPCVTKMPCISLFAAKPFCWDVRCSSSCICLPQRPHIVLLPQKDFHMLPNLADTPRPTLQKIFFSWRKSLITKYPLPSSHHSSLLQHTYTHNIGVLRICNQQHPTSIRAQLYSLGYTYLDISTWLYRLRYTHTITSA